MPRKKVSKPEDVIESTLVTLAASIKNINVSELSAKDQIALFSSLVRLQRSLRKDVEEDFEITQDVEVTSGIEELRNKVLNDRKSH